MQRNREEMKAKHLATLLQGIDDFDKPQIDLEQYRTPTEIAVAILRHIDEEGDVDECTVADLGCGTGVFLVGAAALGAPFYVGIDIDANVLRIAKNNLEEREFRTSDLIAADLRDGLPFLEQKFDIVVTNPPFGTKKNQGIDIEFVSAGLQVVKQGGKVFSLHKTSTRDFLLRKAKKWPGIDATCIAELRWNLENSYKFHKKSSVDIMVDLFCFQKL